MIMSKFQYGRTCYYLLRNILGWYNSVKSLLASGYSFTLLISWSSGIICCTFFYSECNCMWHLMWIFCNVSGCDISEANSLRFFRWTLWLSTSCKILVKSYASTWRFWLVRVWIIVLFSLLFVIARVILSENITVLWWMHISNGTIVK